MGTDDQPMLLLCQITFLRALEFRRICIFPFGGS